MLKHQELTEQIIGIFFNVYNELGHGFLEKIYQNALFFALQDAGFQVEAQKQIKVHFRSRLVGEYYADLIVNGAVILELKAASSLKQEHEMQLVNYLKATNIEVGLLLNFGIKPEFRRKMWFKA